jgi:hypothetical protein
MTFSLPVPGKKDGHSRGHVSDSAWVVPGSLKDADSGI